MTYASRTSEQEWTDLVSAASLRGNTEHQQPPSSTTAEQSLSMYFVALWNLYCWGSDNLQNGQCSSSTAHIFGEMSAKIPAPGSSSVHEHSSNPSIVATCSASQINWCMSAVTYLGVCFWNGVGGVKKDVHKAVPLFQRAVDAGEQAVTLWERAATAGDAAALFNLGVCLERGVCGDLDTSKAVTLYQMAADVVIMIVLSRPRQRNFIRGLLTLVMLLERLVSVYVITMALVEQDTHKAVTLWQGAADAGDADALCNLGLWYEIGDGDHRDASKAVTLLQRAADGGSANAMYRLACHHSQGVGGLAKDIHQAHRLALTCGSGLIGGASADTFASHLSVISVGVQHSATIYSHVICSQLCLFGTEGTAMLIVSIAGKQCSFIEHYLPTTIIKTTKAVMKAHHESEEEPPTRGTYVVVWKVFVASSKKQSAVGDYAA
ncbi:hypothetical protein Pelo_14923 [Pelomyxa schiedti]|nr:hypothetical protein Pelo_14923 [Pelomyxa schiedti]